MAINTASTLTSTTSEAIKNRYYDELFLRVAEANLVHQQLGQLNRQIPKGENGATVYWTRWVNLALVTAGQGEGVPTSAVILSAVNVTGACAQYDNAVSISDLMAQYSFGDVMKAAMQRLAYNAGLSLDTVVREAVVASGVPQYAAAQTAILPIPITAVLTIGELRKAMRTLESANAFRVGGGENPNDAFSGNGYWVSVISPYAKYDLMGDSTTGAWIDANRYAGSENIFSGEVGKLYGIRFIETSNAKVYGVASAGSAAVSATVHTSLITGSDFFGVTTAQNLQTFIKDFGSGGVADPTNKQATAGWKCTFGAAVLNSAFAVSLYHAVTT
jgi:N4-gp56 family major capsid protein